MTKSVGGIAIITPRKGGNLRARWGKGKTRVDWNTGTKDPRLALENAVEELRKRTDRTIAPAARLPPPAPAPPASSPAPAGAPAANGARRPLGDAFARVLTPPAPAGAAAPAILPDAVLAPLAGPLKAAAAEAAEELEHAQVEQVRHVHKVVGKSAAYLLEGALKRACRFAGREPEDMDDDEQALMREGMQELAARYLGTKKLTPGGKVIAASVCAGVGMYMGGKPIPQPAALKLVPGQRAETLEGPDDGGKGA